MSQSNLIAIIGAGAAGLAAARRLTAAGLPVEVFEARERIGGRVFTVHPPEQDPPIELGAEFIHGKPPETFELIEKEKIELTEVVPRHWHLRDGHLIESGEFWKELEAVMDQMKQVGPHDLSFDEFLREYKQTHALGEAEDVARMFVEGFHAARTDRVSVFGLNKTNEAAERINDDKQFRTRHGYDLILRSLYDEAVSSGARFHFNAVVRHVSWKPDHVELNVGTPNGEGVFKASRAVITLPLGVLQAPPGELGYVEFLPPLHETFAAAGRLAMGHVVRVVLRFHEPWWEALTLNAADGSSKDLKELSFIHAPEHRFPTWWTQLSMRTSLLVGWAGGPRAQKLAQLEDADLVAVALESLSGIFARPESEFESLLAESYVHNWSRDPLTRGGYAYVPVGGLGAAETLAQPVANTLFFAGEAANTEGHIGTVHGAIQSGYAAAEKLLATLAR